MKIGWKCCVLLAGLGLLKPETVPAAVAPINQGLALNLTASQTAAVVGDLFSYQITVANSNNSFVTNAIILDTLPDGVQYVSSSGTGTYDVKSGQWFISPGSAGSVSTLRIEVYATTIGKVTNTATLTRSTPTGADVATPSASVAVTVGLTAPLLVLNYPSNITVNASALGVAVVEFAPQGSGGSSSPLTITAFPPSSSTFSLGITPVMVTVKDSRGDSTNGTFTVTVLPGSATPVPMAKTTSIVLTCSSNLTITASTPNGTNVYFTTSAYGGCSSPLNLSSSPPSGSTFPIGQTTVTTTASDNCGNTTNCTFTVTVNRQTYPPIVLTCSSNLTITASTPNGTNVYFTTSAYGGCSSPLNLSSSPPSGSTFPIGQTIVTTTASDNCGNTTNCTFTVTVTPQNTSAMVLSIGTFSNQLRLSWPASFAGYTLASSPDLFSPVWKVVTNQPMFEATGASVLLPLSSTQQFFQLLPP